MSLTPELAKLGTAPEVRLEDVKWRADSTPSDRGTARFIPYVNAEIVAALLDEWVGVENWKDDYSPAHGKGLWCHLSIRHPETGEWVTKTDVGVPSNTEPEKGTVSDAFKRAACLKWGVARNVYRLPNLWAPVDVRTGGNGKKVGYPNDKTNDSLLRQLKERGFENAVVQESTSDHDDENAPGGAEEPTSTPNLPGEGGEGASNPPVDPPASASSDLTDLRQIITALQADLPKPKLKLFRSWAIAQGFRSAPDGTLDLESIGEEKQALAVIAHLQAEMAPA